MKKNNSTKLTALLLASVLATSCFVGGTLARYVTSTSSEDSARVAVWGINADEVTMDLFDATYTVNGVTVAQSEDGDNIIAPGTEKDNYFSIVNLDDNLKPEVMYEIAINLDDSEIDPLILNNPSIVWRLDEGIYGTWEETKAQVLALSGDASGKKVYAPLEITTEFASGKTHKIGWKWIMDNNNNVMDTEMGNKAVDSDISAKINIKVTATQAPTSSAIPVGATYKIARTGEILSEGDNFPETTEIGDVYTYEDFTYEYTEYSVFGVTGKLYGWNPIAIDKTQETYSEILSNINKKAVTNMTKTFEDCTNMTVSPAIPNSVDCLSLAYRNCVSLTVAPTLPNNLLGMYHAFDASGIIEAPSTPETVVEMDCAYMNCTSLTTAAKIPASVIDFSHVYFGCTNLTGSVEIDSNATHYMDALEGTQITEITGTTTFKEAILATK